MLCKSDCLREKKPEGGTYQQASYVGFRVAMNRTLLEQRGSNIISDPVFKRCNDAFDGMLKKLRRGLPLLTLDPAPVDDIDDLLRSLDDDGLSALEKPQQSPPPRAPSLPVNFAGANFSGASNVTFNFSINK
eukprot:scpid8980/ scgid1746/ 